MLALGVGVGVMGVMCWKIGWARIGGYLTTVGWGFLWVCLAGAATSWVESIALWIGIGRAAPMRHVTASAIAGAAVNSFTPFGELGEAIKWNLLKRDADSEKVMSGILLWNVLYRVTKYAYAFLVPVLVWLIHPSLFPGHRLVWLESAALLAFLPSFVFFVLVWRGSAQLVVRLAQRMPLLRTRHPEARLEKARRVDEQVRAFVSAHRRDAALIVALLFLARILSALEVYAALHALGSSLDLATSLFLYGGMLIVSVYLSIAPVQVGVSEVGQYALFGFVGLAPTLGFAQALVRRVRILISNALGFTYLAYRSARG